MKNQKLLIISIGIVVVGLGIYLFVSRSSDSGTVNQPTGTLISDTTGEDAVSLESGLNPTETTPFSSPEGAEIATLLKNINVIKLDQSVLSSPAFLALVDSSLVLPDVSVSGRVNPFSLSGATLSPSSTTTPQ